MSSSVDFEEFAEVFLRLKNALRTSARDIPLKMHEMGILMTIARIGKKEGGHITPSKLSSFMELSRPAITPILNTLESNGYIERIMSKTDRRSIYIVMTEKGAKFEQQMKKQSQKLVEKFLNKLGDEDAKDLIRLMKKAELTIKEITNENES